MRLPIILIFIIFISCHGNSNKSGAVNNESTKLQVNPGAADTSIPHDTLKSLSETPLIWFVDFDKKTKLKNPGFKESYLNIDTLIRGLNSIHTNIKPNKIKVSGDTLFTEIKDSEYLGERIGSNGASGYIAEVVVNLTTVKNIDFVKIDFADGSHISQGTWSKEEFKNYKIIQ